MISDHIFVEVLSDDNPIDADTFEYTVIEADDDIDSKGIVLEELNLPVFVEETDSANNSDLSEFNLIIEEPEDMDYAEFGEHVELFFNSTPLNKQPRLSHLTSIRDLFEIARSMHIGEVDKTEELWFHIEPLGLEVGEENSFTYEPTLGDLMRLIDINHQTSTQQKKEPHLKINIESRESFYHKFRDLLSNLNLDSAMVEDFTEDQDGMPDVSYANKRRRNV